MCVRVVRFVLFVAVASLGCSDDSDPAEASASTEGSGGLGGSGGAQGMAGGGAAGVGGSSTASGSGGHAGSVQLDYCTACARGAQTGTVENGDVKEASGIAASAVHAGVFYLHNDSGDSARFFAVDETGADLGTWNVSSAIANDWEDLARGPCGGQQSCVFLGDIGNNSHAPSKPYAIYRVIEPDQLGADGVTVGADALPFAYPSDYPNSETLLVHPQTGVVTLVTKVDAGPSAIFEMPMPLTPGEEAVLVPAGELEPPSGDIHYTGGDVHPTGAGVLLRTYTDAFFYAMSPGESVAEALQKPPCVVPPPGGGEAIAWLADGTGYIGVPEGNDPPLTVVSCR